MERSQRALAAHLEQLRACRRCPDVFGPPVVGAVPGASILLVGQAPGPREREMGRPFVFTAGTTLFRWLASIGAEEEPFRRRVYMGAVIRCFPGKLPNGQGDRKPARGEVENCRSNLRTEIRLLRPALVLLVGKLAIEQFIPHRRLDEVVGRSFEREAEGHAFTAIPLPHPSGLSRWIQTEGGKALIGEALGRIAAHPAWRAAFPGAGCRAVLRPARFCLTRNLYF
jgi:uracil-DNA glycosylase